MTANQHPYYSLNPEKILDAIESLGYQCDGRLTVLNSYENRVFQIGIEDTQPVIAKFYRPNRWSYEQIVEEHQFSHELKQEEWPIVAPLISSDGQSIHTFEDFTFALFPRYGGHAPELDKLDTLELLGRTIGRLHGLSAKSPFKHRPHIDIESYGTTSREYLLSSGHLPDSIKTAYETLTNDILKLIESRFQSTTYQPIRLHADCHPGNILWRNERAVFVDFDDSRMGPAIQDIWMLLSGDKEDQSNQLEAILEGYEMFSHFNGTELALIEPLRALRMMHYTAWIARRWHDPAFPKAFPWFNTERYWSEHVLALREQFANLHEAPLRRAFGNH